MTGSLRGGGGGLRLSPALRPRLARHHAAPRHALEQLLDLGRAVDELVRPELECRILYELNEGDEKTPWMRPIYYEPLQQYSVIILV